MALYGQWQNPTAWLYVALHGTYGSLWVLKNRLFPDTRWEQRTLVALRRGRSVGQADALLDRRLARHGPGRSCAGWYAALCVAIYTVGIFFHFASDMQKSTWPCA
ncbi:MAG: hypothetical protein R3A10_06095 [Caldilineaceae bacterium]